MSVSFHPGLYQSQYAGVSILQTQEAEPVNKRVKMQDEQDPSEFAEKVQLFCLAIQHNLENIHEILAQASVAVQAAIRSNKPFFMGLIVGDWWFKNLQSILAAASAEVEAEIRNDSYFFIELIHDKPGHINRLLAEAHPLIRGEIRAGLNGCFSQSQ